MPLLVIIADATPLIGGWAGWLNVTLAALSPVVLGVLWWRDVIRPGSLAKGPPRSSGLHPANVWIVCGIGLWLAGGGLWMIGQSFATMLLGNEDSARRLAVALLCTYTLAVPLAVFVLVYLADGKPAPDLVPRVRMWPRGMVWGAISFVMFVPLWTAVNWASVWVATLVTGEAPSPIAHDALDSIIAAGKAGDPWVIAVIVCVTIGAPVVEECLYRGVVQTGLVRATGSRWAAVFIASTLFTPAHLGNVPLHGLPVLLTLAVAMGIAYERTASLVVPITMHVLFNVLNVLMAVTG